MKNQHFTIAAICHTSIHAALAWLCCAGIWIWMISGCSTGDSTHNNTPQAQQQKPQQEPSQQEHNQQHDSREERSTVELSDEQVAMAGILLGTLEEKSLSGSIKANGMLDAPPQNVVNISPHLGGYVRSTPLLQGLRVRKGQTLAVLEHQDVIMLQQDFLETRSRLEFAEAEFKRQEALQRENVNAVKTFEQSKAEYKSLLARATALRQRLALIGITAENLREQDIRAGYSIVSPLDGYVTAVNITLGQYVAPGAVLCRIINTAHLHAEIQVFERDVPRIREGQRVRLTLVNESTERLATVYLIGREVTQERTVRIHAHLQKEDSHLLPNTAFKAIIETGAHPVSTLPDAAFVNAHGKDYIFLVQERNLAEKTTMFQMVEVRKGVSDGGFTEVSLFSEEMSTLLSQGGKHANNNGANGRIVVQGAYFLLSALNNASDEHSDGHGH